MKAQAKRSSKSSARRSRPRCALESCPDTAREQPRRVHLKHQLHGAAPSAICSITSNTSNLNFYASDLATAPFISSLGKTLPGLVLQLLCNERHLIFTAKFCLYLLLTSEHKCQIYKLLGLTWILFCTLFVTHTLQPYSMCAQATMTLHSTSKYLMSLQRGNPALTSIALN